MNKFKKTLSQLLQSILKNKLLFISLILIQIFFIVIASSSLINYQVKILDDVSKVMDPIQNANYDEKSLSDGGAFLKDFAKLNTGFDSLKTNLYKLALTQVVIFAIFNGLLWSLSFNIFRKEKIKLKNFIMQIFNFSTITVIGVLLFTFISTFTIKTFYWQRIMQGDFSSAADSLFIIFIALYFFMILAYLNINQKTNLKIQLKSFITNLKNYKLATIYSIGLIIIAGLLYLINVFMQTFYTSLFLVFLLLITINLIRLYLIINKSNN
jgi:hypothetical protein